MASSYTDNSGIELIGVGEQSGTWGTTTNNNLEIIDKVLNGVTDVAVSGNMNIGVTDGDKTSNGHSRVLKLTGSLSSGATLTITPATREAFYIVHNAAGDAITFTQGSGGNVVVPNNAKAFIYADGKDGSAAVVDLLTNVFFGGALLTATGAELNLMDGGTSATSTTIADADRLIVNDDGTMVQAAVTDLSTYFNSNLVEVKSALALTDSNQTVTATGATSVYQRVTSDGAHTLKIAITNLAIGQYVIIDKTTSANSVTLDWTNNSAVTSNGITLGSSVEFALGIYNGTGFSFTETVKF
tara:strand:+ start:37 stop:933 length:897 start_codon:yes stop_codon:yes gene_type:complete